jgi:hypothetical protein
MCRRWTGAAFATLVWFARADLAWQGEPPALFRSSPIAVRSHCAGCGTPLALAYDSRSDIALAVGTFDDPAAVTPRHHYGGWRPAALRETRERW